MASVRADSNIRDNAAVRADHAAGGDGVFGFATSTDGSNSGRGVVGVGLHAGVEGNSTTGFGVFGRSDEFTGAEGRSTNGLGMFAKSETNEGMNIRTASKDAAALRIVSENPESQGPSLLVQTNGRGAVARFEGNVIVTGDIQLANADCAENFDVACSISAEAGTVMVLKPDGKLWPCDRPYDRCVVGVVSGAGLYRPAIVLDQTDTGFQRSPVALIGKVYCKVDATENAIAMGDLLTTSQTSGFAMAAADPTRAFGAVIGKALAPLSFGRGLIPILVTLQ